MNLGVAGFLARVTMLPGIERLTAVAVLCVLPQLAPAYGPEGHLIAGIAAQPALCPAAREQVAGLGGGEDLARLGLWADRVRSEPRYRETAAWHYLNVADGAVMREFRHPPEGDVIAAIERSRAALRDESRADGERAEALKFLVHFVVDIHQPLHVGRESDRGGNDIELRFRGDTTNLHRFWDTGAIAEAGLSVGRYARDLRAQMRNAAASGASLDPVVWAEESLALRAEVYAFDAERGTIDAAYAQRAASITRRRLAEAALRLAGTLNAVFCAPERNL